MVQIIYLVLNLGKWGGIWVGQLISILLTVQCALQYFVAVRFVDG